jgi:excisionase family DNA binding protein
MPKKLAYVNAVEAAHLTGLSEKTIRRRIERGEIKAEKRSTSYAIKARDLDKLVGPRPATPDMLLLRIQDLEDAQEQQAETISTQAAQIESQTKQIAELEQRLAPTRTRTMTGQIPPRPVTLLPFTTPGQESDQAQQEQEEGRTPTTPLAALGHLPPGSVLVAHFARSHGLNPRTITDQVRARKISATTIDKGGRPEYWLSPEQQTALILNWLAEGQAFTTCEQCPHN